jgi:hypothetical protein
MWRCGRWRQGEGMVGGMLMRRTREGASNECSSLQVMGTRRVGQGVGRRGGRWGKPLMRLRGASWGTRTRFPEVREGGGNRVLATPETWLFVAVDVTWTPFDGKTNRGEKKYDRAQMQPEGVDSYYQDLGAAPFSMVGVYSLKLLSKFCNWTSLFLGFQAWSKI